MNAPTLTTSTPRGTLYLVPAPLDFGCDTQMPLQDSLPDATLTTAARLTHWVCENAKSARAYLKRVNAAHPLALPLQEQTITELPREVHKKGDHGDKGCRAGRARYRAGQRSRHACRCRPGQLGGARRARAGHYGGAAGRAGVTAAGAGCQRFERAELCLCRLPAARQRRTCPAHPRTRIAGAQDSSATRSQSVQQWRRKPGGPDKHTPAVFAIGG